MAGEWTIYAAREIAQVVRHDHSLLAAARARPTGIDDAGYSGSIS
jgi:hypothetical protein